jgi:ribosomal protein L7/L12
MNTSLVLTFVAAFVVLVLVVLAFVSRRRDGRMIVQQSPLTVRQNPPPRMSGSFDTESREIDVALGREILEFLEKGQKLQAVKLVRERTGWSLEKSLDAVNKLDGLRRRIES